MQASAGTDAFFTIRGKKEWMLILKMHWKQHLASEYDEKDGVLRVKIKPKKILIPKGCLISLSQEKICQEDWRLYGSGLK